MISGLDRQSLLLQYSDFSIHHTVRKVYLEKNISSQKLELELSNLANGLYFVKSKLVVKYGFVSLSIKKKIDFSIN